MITLEGKTKGAPSRHDIHLLNKIITYRYIEVNMEQFWTMEEEFFFTAIEEKMNEEAKEESE